VGKVYGANEFGAGKVVRDGRWEKRITREVVLVDAKL
jgi:hypothetical protein